MWRNWQTRQLQVLVGVKLVEVRILSSAVFFLLLKKTQNNNQHKASLKNARAGRNDLPKRV